MNFNNKKDQKKKKFLTYFSIAFVLLFSVVGIAYAMTFAKALKNEPIQQPPDNNIGAGSSSGGSTQEKNTLMNTLFGPKNININVAVFGTDDGDYRTDTIFVANFDSKNKRVSLLSIPRDTRVVMTKEMQDKILESRKAGTGGAIPYNATCKINETHAYAPKNQRSEFSVMQLENLLGIKIDHYVKVDLDAFVNIVDAFGGITIEVPQDMKYEDPYQDLYIDLKKGLQHLDGKQAEQLVRFRRYPEGDVARVKMQQVFMKEFMKQILNTKNIISNLPTLISALYNDVETNVTIANALSYAKYIKDVDLDKVTMELLPGEGQYVGDISYFLHDVSATVKVIDRLFYNTEEVDEEIISSKSKNIEILNGSSTGGIAGKTQDKLKAEGFNVVSIGDYNGTREQQTVILVKDDSLGKDLKKYFKDSRIKVDTGELTEDIDIRIIIGKSEL